MAPGLPAEVLLVQKGQQIAPAVATDRPNKRSTDGAGYRQRRGSTDGFRSCLRHTVLRSTDCARSCLSFTKTQYTVNVYKKR